MQNNELSYREKILKEFAVEIDKSLRVGPVTHIKHCAVGEGQYGLACLESHLLGNENDKLFSLHEWAFYGTNTANSIINPKAPRGFMLVIKKDSKIENSQRGRDSVSIPIEAKTPDYEGDYLKLDWIYPHKKIHGLGITRQYFYAVERCAKTTAFPSIHIDATHNGLSYWSRKEFNLKIPKEQHEILIESYKAFKANHKKVIQNVRSISPYFKEYEVEELPAEIDPTKPFSIPRVFFDTLGAILSHEGNHLHFYKKF